MLILDFCWSYLQTFLCVFISFFFTDKFLFSYLLLKDGHNCLIQGPNKKILCQLSMLERRMAQGKAFLLVLETTLCCSQVFLASLVLVEINKKPRMFNFWTFGFLGLYVWLKGHDNNTHTHTHKRAINGINWIEISVF